MKPNLVTEPISISRDQIAAFRLSRQHLLERAPAKELLSVAGDMTGAQAQLLSAAQVSLWSRVQNLTIGQIGQALNEKTLVKAACMRRTLFLVPSAHLAVFARGSARRADKEMRWTQHKGVPDRLVDTAIEAALTAMDQPLTRPEIAERVSRALGVQSLTVHGAGWGSRGKVAAIPVGEITFPVVYFLHLVSARAVICYGPNRGNEPTFIRADAWIPGWQDMPREQAETDLLRTYLRAYGPSTPADYAMWSGMTLTDAREIWGRGVFRFAQVNAGGWTGEVLQEDLDELVQATIERPSVRLLPYFDTFLLGHRKRDHLVALEHQPEVYRPQGWIAPVVLLDGRVIAAWEYAREGNRLRVDIKKFSPISPGILETIHEEARDLGRFLGASSVDVQID